MRTKRLAVFLFLAALTSACGSQGGERTAAIAPGTPSEGVALRADLENLLRELTPLATAMEPACDLGPFSREAPIRVVVVADDSLSARALDPRTREMMRALTDTLSFGDTFVAFWPNQNQPWLNNAMPAHDTLTRWPGTPPIPPAEVTLDGSTVSLEELRRMTRKVIGEFDIAFPSGDNEQIGQGKGLSSTAQIRWRNSARRILQSEEAVRAAAGEWRSNAQNWVASAARYNQECALLAGLRERAAEQKRLIDAATPMLAPCSPVRQAITRAAATARRGEAGVRLIVISGDLEPSPCSAFAELAALPEGLLEGIHVLVAPFRPDDARSNYISAEQHARALLGEGSPESVTVIFDDEPTAAIATAALGIVNNNPGQMRKGVVSR